MELLQDLADRIWRIALASTPLVFAALFAARRARPALAHALLAATCVVLVLPLAFPRRRHIFELPPALAAAAPATQPFSLGRLLASAPLPGWVALVGTVGLALAVGVRTARVVRTVPGRLAGSVMQERVELLATELGLRRTPLCLTSDTRSPMIWDDGCRRPRLVLPEGAASTWSEGELDAILLHELAHLKRRDSLTALLAAVTSALYWWNPLVWMLRVRIHETAELACDRCATTLREQERTAYAHALLEHAWGAPARASAPIVHHLLGAKRRIARRLTAILEDGRAPHLLWRGRAAVALIVGLGLATNIGELGAVATHHDLSTLERVRTFLAGEPRAERRREAVDALGNLGPAARDSLPLLVEAFASEPSPSVRYEILDSVARIDREEGSPMRAELAARGERDPVARVRRRARELGGAQ